VKPTLQSFFNEPLLTPEECFIKLAWTFEKFETGYKNITCCSEAVKAGGWFGAEHLYCNKCKKGMQDVTGILPASNLSVTCVDAATVQLPEDDRVWLPLNIWG
jgi:hypothetical protein